MKGETISEQVEVPGRRPATFRLRWKAEDSYDLYRGSRKLGTARVEENGDWTARFEDGAKPWQASGTDASDLLRLVGRFLLAHEALAVAPAKAEAPTDRVPAAERRLSEKFKAMQEDRRRSALKGMIKDARRKLCRGMREGMPKPEEQKASLEAIAAELEWLVTLASRDDQSLLAFMLNQAKTEAMNQLRQFKN